MKYIGGRKMPDCMDYCKSLEKENKKLKNGIINIKKMIHNVWKIDFNTLTDKDIVRILNYTEKVLKDK